jgi:L-asparaginase II
MVATCVAAGWPVGSYLEPEHPLQQHIASVLSELSGDPVSGTAVDGCGAPAHAITLLGLARSFAALVRSANPVARAVAAHPQWVGGTGRDVTDLMVAVPGLVAKDGAEAVWAAALPDAGSVAVKISDGGSRAGVVVLTAALQLLGAQGDALLPLATKPVLGHGRPVGEVRPIAG